MAMTMQQISPVAHLPLVLGVVRKLNVAAINDTFCPPHPAHIISCGRGVEALLLAILDGHHALYKVGARLADRGMLPLLQPGLQRASLHDYRLGQILDALFAVNLNRVFAAIALNVLEVYALATPWLHQDTTTITLYGAYEEEARPVKGLVPPRPAYGPSKDGHDDLKQVLLSLGVSSDGLPLRMGLRDGNPSDSTETPVAIEACLALGMDGVRGMVADSKAYGQRTLGLCLEQGVGLITLVPRTCAVRQEVEAWGQQHGALALVLEKPGRTRQESPRRWHGHSVVRRVPVEYADGRLDVAEIRFLVVLSSQGSRAWRRARPARGSAVVCLCRRRGGGHCRVRRAWPGAAWAQATALALPWPPLSGRSGQCPSKTDASRPSTEGRSTPGCGPLSPRRAPRGPGPLRGRARVDRPGHHGATRGVYGYRAAPGVSGTTYHGGTGLSLDQESCCHQPGVAGATGTDCGVGHAHRRGIAGVCGHPTTGPALSPRACPAMTRQQRPDGHAYGSRGVGPLYASDARALRRGQYAQPPSPWRPRLSSDRLSGGGY